MGVLKLAWALIRIPHVSISLFLVPTLVSLGLVFAQLVGTGVVLQSWSAAARPISAPNKSPEKTEVRTLRWILHGSYAPRGQLKVCRWIAEAASPTGEAPPSRECLPDRLDLAIQTEHPERVDVSTYEQWFQGETDRLHVCRRCQPDVVIRLSENGTASTQARSVYGLGVLYMGLSKRHDQIIEKRAEYVLSGQFQKTIGDMSFFLPEVGDFVQLAHTNPLFPLTVNVVLIVMIALWLALRAHRKVLEYFSQNDVLLPLVAATGKRTFYAAIWLLTLARVSCFLVGAIPMAYFGLRDVAGQDIFIRLVPDLVLLVVWAVVLVATLGLLTTIASIADLKHRDSFFAILFRYLPFACAMLGAFLWLFSFVFVSDAASDFRLALAALPIVGLLPLLVSPILKLPIPILIIHGVCSMIGLFSVLRANTAWFAAHLEEV